MNTDINNISSYQVRALTTLTGQIMDYELRVSWIS